VPEAYDQLLSRRSTTAAYHCCLVYKCWMSLVRRGTLRADDILIRSHENVVIVSVAASDVH
jgi:hypothetical protein